MAKLAARLEPKGLAVVAVNVAEKPEVVTAYLAKNTYDFRCGWIVTVRSPGSTGDGVAHARHDRPRRKVATHLIGLHRQARCARTSRSSGSSSRSGSAGPSAAEHLEVDGAGFPDPARRPAAVRCAAPPGPARPWARSPA